jgi:sirohydrochlorin ferrochelatase
MEEAVESLISQGCDSVYVLPLLVFKGKHTLEDIPAQIKALRSKHPGLPIDVEPHLSRLPHFRDVLLHALENTILPSVPHSPHLSTPIPPIPKRDET